MEDPIAAPDRRTFTPAIVASAIFAAACAVFAVAFVGAREGLQLPIAETDPPVAVASSAPSTPAGPTPTPAATPTAPPVTLPPATPGPTVPPVTPPPPSAPVATPYVVPTLEPGDPLLVLDGCPGYPGCFEYVVARGDTLSGIISRYLLDIDILEALNPGRLSDRSLIVVGQLLYLGRDPFARLDPCPNGEACALYVVQSGDSISEIADRYLLTRDAILAANPDMPRPIQVGQVIKLPRLPAG